ncbi:MAG: GNAT family N-acetyltransferase, partial [Candidatus Latescibacteria bacterium]|nr:GNAT family N-acetyltransferase [Candidatus Latescibacterota bacterium]
SACGFKESSVTQVKDWCREWGIALLAAKIDCGALALLHGMEAWGMRIVDCELTWVAGSERPLSEPVCGVDLELVQNSEVDGIGELGRTFALDRFHGDYRIGDRGAERLWAESLRNASAGRADQVVVAHDGDAVAGAVTCFVQHYAAQYLDQPVCDLVHVAVAPAWQGKGLATAMLAHALAWADAVTELVQVGTQARNYAANALYGKSGFRLAASQYSVHGYWPVCARGE